MLRIKNLQFHYPGKEPMHFPDIDLPTVDPLLVLGPSGSGKTTFLHLIAGLLRIQTGSIELDATALQDLSPRKMDAYRARHMGIVFQKAHFIQSLNCLENMLLVQNLAGKPSRRQEAQAILESLGLKTKIREKPHRLSEGEKQRLNIALAILNEPRLILADEPTSSLDDENCHIVLDLLKHVSEKNQSHLLVITHDQRVKETFSQHISL